MDEKPTARKKINGRNFNDSIAISCQGVNADY